jgi:type I restriction enzyme, S subunit
VLLTNEFINQVNATTFGARMPRADWAAIGDLFIPLPPPPEQRAIVKYLDYETGYIDSLINSKQQLIDLLAEKRQAFISHAVTRGLNSCTPMCNIGIAWLGDIPTHWQVVPLKRLVKTKITDGPHETPDYDPEGIPFVSAEAVQNGRINFDSRWGNIPLELQKKYSQKLLPKRNDIFMVKSGATTGKLAYVDVDMEFNVWSPLALIRANEKKVLSTFLFIVLHAEYVQRQVRATWSAGTQPNISMGAIEELNIITPPLEEQQAIVDYLDHETGKIDKLSEVTQTSIALLIERRAALISAAVTGQIKIPEASCN